MFDKKAITKTVGLNLRRLRTEKNLSMQDLATLAEMEKSQIFKIENAKLDPQVSTISNLSNALGVEIIEFFK
ncbi:helix-turn-helix transcriptional regulator [Mucilaginibacter sp. JRF]|nr:helix-turn-helix transcriptional regulator [Mucilaginibacter sp. JRF]